ncbi:MAG: DUF255 domain-containing protein [Verrucomicrobia bacterium]|nr:DUF255 domain-containing protein [Verrucomicrobiota bacterium]
MSSDNNETSVPKPKIPRWIITLGLLVLIVVTGFFVARWWTSTSTNIPPERELATSAITDSVSPEVPSSQREGSASLPTQEEAVEDEKHKFTNHLIHETSPYLLQHAHNPVNWYPWGPEALAKAKKEDKPIFLSVGYSTCYWCHVMEKQSFETEEVANILNQHFIAIKVDREERPDIDEQYMLATQFVTGRGGWPNSIWLTPDGRPWMAGTYFPQAQFMQILNNLATYWKDRRTEVEQQADRLAEAIRRAGSGSETLQAGPGAGSADQKLIDSAVAEYKRAFDENRGGFSSRPKFPPHGVLRVILHEYRRTGDKTLLPMITRTLDGMWLGGMHDHVGGGFHRYSTDSVWLLPHFEKMLYDNAQLMRAYTDGYVLSGIPRYREAVEDIYRWVQSEMTSPQGGFYSAIDSGEVGKEGETYIWRYQDVVEVLGENDAKLFAEVYNLEKQGNFREESTGEEPGTNVIHLQKPLAEIATTGGKSPDTFKTQMALLRTKLLTWRNTLVQPHKDDKILTSWNGLMISALANAGRQLNEPKYTEAAEKAANFILTHLVDDQKRLLRTYRAGQAKLPGYLDDYAYLAEGLLDLYAATGEKRWLTEAQRLGDVMLTEFEDENDSAFFFTANAHEDLLMRSKSLSGGGNIPSANGVAVLVLLELNRIVGLNKYVQSAEGALEALTGIMWRSPRGLDSGIHATAVAIEHRVVNRLQTIDGDKADASKKLGPVTAYLFSSRLNVLPGETLQLALALDVDEGWHLYGPNPDAGFLIPTNVTLLPNAAFSVGDIQTPEPRKKLDPVLKQVLATYEGRIWYFVPVKISEDATDGETTLTVEVKSQACDEKRCLMPRTDTIEISLNVSAGGSRSSPRHPAIFNNVSPGS